MRQLFGSTILLFLAVLLAGCARYPTTGTSTTVPARTLYCEMTVNGSSQGQIDPNDYYFLAITVDQNDVTGPVPVVTGPGLSSGWGTISGLSNNLVQIPPFYVYIHNGTFTQFRDSGDHSNFDNLHAPFRYGVTTDNKTVYVEIDESLLTPLVGSATDPIIQANWITMQYIDTPPQDQIGLVKQYDGFGPTGSSYLHPMHLLSSQSYESTSLPGSPYYEPVYGPDERTASDPNIDISHWKVEVRINQ